MLDGRAPPFRCMQTLEMKRKWQQRGGWTRSWAELSWHTAREPSKENIIQRNHDCNFPVVQTHGTCQQCLFFVPLKIPRTHTLQVSGRVLVLLLIVFFHGQGGGFGILWGNGGWVVRAHPSKLESVNRCLF
ncbi:hypothetical protein M431DRAFT_403474 [Trichoderma harzianum CBS 226.95]|uniref:Uncharacterized protein n=1 Tax=Trichoderma harzianum CBS 226.95 TaxID=983964 RepID=A0A2T4AEM4_TRIHA|nr:hypothetical protein M431DRAFT_403474 [Trichoderma harzianum CBS 226.95]PTB55545.1 hypothetical protein M431DRAFT_403474 [Trichoderma harzianum CBS 226.95]